jgi:peptide/nickel transport system permease protein
MFAYIIRRLLLLPLTLFVIVLVNFVIINLAPGDPTAVTEVSQDGDASRKEDSSIAFGSDQRYLAFREFYGLTLPILFNRWPSLSQESVYRNLSHLSTRRWLDGDLDEMSVKEYEQIRIRFGDQARYMMPLLYSAAENSDLSHEQRNLAVHFLVRGGTKQGFVGPQLSAGQKAYNRKVAKDNQYLYEQRWEGGDDASLQLTKLANIGQWMERNNALYRLTPTVGQQAGIFFFETRFCRYLTRVLTLNFGTLRNDSNRTVISEVLKRFKYSLTLSLFPMLLTFGLCQFFGFTMALKQNGWQDFSLNIVFLILYATPVFVVAPFLIEKVAMGNTFPFTDIAIPFSGFNSTESEYRDLTSSGRLFDIVQHITLPLIAVLYSGLATQSRLARTAVLEVLRQDYVRTARAKGLGILTILGKHVGRNAAITIVTSLAGSLGVVLGGSLIIETIFGIDGFGRFFYEAIVNRDYNVIMFSALAGAFLSLIGYLLADLSYTFLDPRVTLD